VHGARSAVVTGVQGPEQFAQLGPAALAHHEPVGPHPERLAHQPVEPDRTRAVEVRLARLERDDVRMRDAQLGDVLDDDDPLVLWRGRQQSGEKRRLAAAARAGDEQVGPVDDQVPDAVGTDVSRRTPRRRARRS
jgi:hypothetical protein